MKNAVPFKKFTQRVIYRVACLLSAVSVVLFVAGTPRLNAAGGLNGGLAWANPSVTALKRVGVIDGTQHQPNLLSNLDCSLMTYRVVGDSTMKSGCFTPSAFGLIDSDFDMVIFNGTDEGLPLQPYWPGQVLAPWPEASGLLVLDASDTGGSYLSLYRNPLASFQDRHNALGQLTAKQLAVGPELPLKDRSGYRLVVNPQTMAFSDGGSWLVVETLGGSFVRINLATLDMTAFAPAFGSQGSPGLLKSQVAVRQALDERKQVTTTAQVRSWVLPWPSPGLRAWDDH